MATQQGKIFLLAGAGALLFMSGKKKKKRSKAKVDPPQEEEEEEEEDLDDDGEVIFDTDDDDLDEGEDEAEDEPVDDAPPSEESAVTKYLDPHGRAQLGRLYQIKIGDSPLEICREALFGSREPVVDAGMRQAAMDLLVRIDCGPWNQALYGVELTKLTPGHAQIDGYWTQRGVSFDPIYVDNFVRMSEGLGASGAGGGDFALIWIPMISLDKYDMEGVISTEGMHHPDTEDGIGGSMIDPPKEITDLGFESVEERTVGCDLPEGDFRKTIVAS